jgi:hypothetical protein
MTCGITLTELGQWCLIRLQHRQQKGIGMLAGRLYLGYLTSLIFLLSQLLYIEFNL